MAGRTKVSPRPASGKAEVPQVYSDAIRCAAQGRVDKLRLLGGDVVQAARDAGGATALCWAAKNGELSTIRYLLDEVKVDAMAAGVGGQNALMIAAVGAYEFTVEEILRAPASRMA